MAAPPTYSDLGKAARDVTDKGYNYGLYKLDVTQKSSSGPKIKIGGKANQEKDNAVDANLETTIECKEKGLKFVEKWNTSNVLATEVTIEDQLAKGVKLAFDTTFAPHTGKKTAKVKAGYKQEFVNAQLDVDCDFGGPTIHGATVLGYKGGLFGIQASFDTGKSALLKHNFALGYLGPDYTAHISVNNGSEFNGSIHHKVCPSLEASALITWVSGANTAKAQLGACYKLDDVNKVRAKINNALQLGLSYEHKIRPGVTVTMSSLIEGKQLNAGGHKFGLGLEMEN